MILSVISLHRAVQPLLVPQTARVEMVHRRAVNLRLESGALLTLCAPELGNGPGALLVAADWPLPWQPGERLELTEAGISGAGCRVEWEGATVWEPGRPPPVGAPAALRQAWYAAVEALEKEFGRVAANSQGWQEFGLDRVTVQEPFLTLAGPGLQALQSHDWPTAVARLVGLGPGLTPSGDDLLVGFLLLALRAGWGVAAPLAGAIRALPPGRTTSVSEALLYWATEGVANERALHWLDGLLQGAPPSIKPVLAIGATSGADFAAGALLALDLFLKERDR